MSTITVEYDFARPPAQVWRALTDPKLLSAWLMENDIQAVVGHEFTFRSKPIGPWDGIVHCKVLEVVELARLAYSWCGGGIDTTVTWTLSKTATGTILRLEHAGFTDANKIAFDAIKRGWEADVVERIQRVLAV